MWLPPHYTGMLTLICRKILTALIYAATGGYESIVNALLKHGATPNLPTDAGWTALKQAGNKIHSVNVTSLLKIGADPNIQNKHGWTPLIDAARGGYRSIVNNLLKSGANPNFRLIRDGLHLCMQQKRLFRHCLFPTDKWC